MLENKTSSNDIIINYNHTHYLKQATPGSAGYDLPAYFKNCDKILIHPHERVLIPTGISLSMKCGYYAQVVPRSGLAIKQGLTVLNAPGIIDSDYTGEIKVILINFSESIRTINNFDRIAQLIFSRYESLNFKIVDNLEETSRGSSGFGSTGV